jgi:hypothetical protein
MIYARIIILIFLIFWGCSELERRPFVKKVQKEKISVLENTDISFDPPNCKEVESYPWERDNSAYRIKIVE